MWRRLSIVAVSMCCVAALSACAHSHRDPALSGSRNVLTEAEIDSSHAASIYDAIARLRADFLTYRGETSLQASRSMPYPVVFVDGQRYGEIADLRGLPASQVAQVRLLRAWEATTHYGAGYPSGIIEVTTKH